MIKYNFNHIIYRITVSTKFSTSLEGCVHWMLYFNQCTVYSYDCFIYSSLLTSRSQSRSSKALLLGMTVLSRPLSTVPTREKVKWRMWLFNRWRFFLNNIANVWNDGNSTDEYLKNRVNMIVLFFCFLEDIVCLTYGHVILLHLPVTALWPYNSWPCMSPLTLLLLTLLYLPFLLFDLITPELVCPDRPCTLLHLTFITSDLIIPYFLTTEHVTYLISCQFLSQQHYYSCPCYSDLSNPDLITPDLSSPCSCYIPDIP